MNDSELIDYVQQAFHMEDEKHQQLLDIATMKEVHSSISSTEIGLYLQCILILSLFGSSTRPHGNEVTTNLFSF